MIGMTVAWHHPGLHQAAAWITLIGKVVAVSSDLGQALVLAPDGSFRRIKTSDLFEPSPARAAREQANYRRREKRYASKRSKR